MRMYRSSEAACGISEQYWSVRGSCNEFLSRLQASRDLFFIFALRVINDGVDETTAQTEYARVL